MTATTHTPDTTRYPHDPEIELLIPEGDVADPEVSIVIPALNEELTIEDFVQWCHEGLAAAGVRGEIVIVDSSTDRTPELALAGGARVLKVPKRGLGRAYMDSIPYIRAPWVIMGDCDCTYDFRLLKPFVDAFRDGYEYVMGSRWKGSIEKGAMPPHHQYFGTPGTTWLLNRLYGSNFSDIHCGMRGITRDALVKIDLHSQSWEYASEMVLKSVHHELKTTEVPVRFLKDRDGRLSHHRRSGWFSPFQAAWINMRAMFVYGADFFVFRPGVVLLVIGLLLSLIPSAGDVEIGSVTLSLYWQLLGLTASVVGAQSLFAGIVAQILFDYTGKYKKRYERVFPYTRSTFSAMGLVALGIALALPLVVDYLGNDLSLSGPDATSSHLAVAGLTFVILGFQLFVFTLLLHGSIVATTRGRPRA